MADRQEWLSLLATSDPQILAVLWADTGLAPDYVILRKAETGSVMVRGRAGSVGKAFNFGEMTVPRASLRHLLDPGRRVCWTSMWSSGA